MKTNILQAKKTLLVLFAMLMPLLASAESVKINGIWYTLNSEDKTAAVTSNPNQDTKYVGSITIPSMIVHEDITYNVTAIKAYAFYSCSSLVSVSIPESVTNIGTSAFSDCYSLVSVNIPEAVTSIESGTFYWCNNLTSINIPVGVTSIGGAAFSYCKKLTSVYIGSMESWCNIDFSYSGSNPLEYAKNLYLNGELVTELVIPNTITEIKDYAFWGYRGLTSVTIPESVTSIGDMAFYECSNLVSANIPNSVTSIVRQAFRGSGLTSITIPESVTSIGGYAFCECENLASVSIPSSVTNIEEFTFAGCSNLTAIILSEGITSIGNHAFSSCSSLTSISIPSSVEYILSGVFDNCKILKKVIVFATLPPFAIDDAFCNYNIELCVPEEALASYQTTAPWSRFASIKNLEGESIEIKKCTTPSISYIDGKVVFTCQTEDVTITSITTEIGAGDRTETTFDLVPTYTINVWATKKGYQNSDIATLTICWVPCIEEHESEETGIITIPSKPVLIQCADGIITLRGLAEDADVTVYTTAGTEVATATATSGSATIDTNLEAGATAIVKVGDYSIKVAIK